MPVIYSIYYNEHENYFEDQDGHIVYNMSKIVEPNKIFLYKKEKGTYYEPSKTNTDVVYELVFDF